ncbi:hypothetical protein [Pseudoalteromonas sp. S16_S37]|uniref:hypothetical protein n=1 Tax=Pseudoalteromonas sp. S16_S37 TaxID=2720228 RepID=UPI001681A496|nr:hypothetical protein [Pseudoalteromonas sp. S16_S37]MBD1582775.1 hypothetical protein [Pseudoalteromonas sp. S16_S37]
MVGIIVSAITKSVDKRNFENMIEKLLDAVIVNDFKSNNESDCDNISSHNIVHAIGSAIVESSADKMAQYDLVDKQMKRAVEYYKNSKNTPVKITEYKQPMLQVVKK